jgi:VIT1/CCC1 family predicted Fe2+/Mn2+ transporter
MSEIHQGISYGIISITMTTIGIVLGFIHNTDIQKKIILTTIISAVASDSISDGYSIYFSNKTLFNDNKKAIRGGLITFGIKLLVGITFAIPFICLDNITSAIYLSIIWSFILLFLDSIYISKLQKYNTIQTRNEVIKQMVLGSIILTIAYVLSHSIEKYYS